MTTERTIKLDLTEKSLNDIPVKHSKFDDRPYGLEENRHVYYKYSKEAEENVAVSLCNFEAKIIEQITRDNGLDKTNHYKIEARLNNGRGTHVIEIPTNKYRSMEWIEDLGVSAVINEGHASQDKLREAIKLNSQDARLRTIFTHTGWREIDGKMEFLTNSGIIANNKIGIEIDRDLMRYSLLEPVKDCAPAIKESLNFLLVARLEVTLPLWSAMYLAPLTEINPQISAFTTWIVGESGSYKSTLVALALSHFGDFDRTNLPANWVSTANRLEELLFYAKDIPIVLDDFKPPPDRFEKREQEKKAERIIRSQADRTGRGRMYSNIKYPRGLLIVTGEDLTTGYSRTARIITLENNRKEVNTLFMDTAQKNKYQYCQAMSNYIAWLKVNWERLKKKLPARYLELRSNSQLESEHPRAPEIIAGLFCGTETAIEFALDNKAIDAKEAKTYLHDAWDIFQELAKKQGLRIEEQRAGRQFLNILKTMYSQGKVKFQPKDSEVQPTASTSSEYIGWYYKDKNGDTTYYLDIEAAVIAVKNYSDAFTWGEGAVKKDLDVMDKLVLKDEGHLTHVIRVGAQTIHAVCLKGFD